MSKRQLRDLEAENQELMKENENISSKFNDAEATVHKLMK